MSDLISRAALLDAMPKNDELFSLDVRRVICDAPTVDAEPVRHGRWVKGENWGVTCSECSCLAIAHDGKNYCPNCGAKMDAKEGI